MNKPKEISRIKELTGLLNKHRSSYYNDSISSISDYEYDRLFDELKELEERNNFTMSTSPTVTVGYEVKSKLEKVKHNHPMLSLDKTKSVGELIDFIGDEKGIAMLKLDGLTISLRYLNGQLISAETRGNGEIGEDILHNARVFSNIPLYIDYMDELIVDGEAIITYDAFEKINASLFEDEKYKNPRNLASGSVRQLDSNVAAERNIKFIAWRAVKGLNNDNLFSNQLVALSRLGFETTPFYHISNEYDNHGTIEEYVDITIETLKEDAIEKQYPIDGLVIGFDDIAYGESLGKTGHHFKNQIAFKFYDEEVETTLLDIDWTVGKTGVLTPTAVFEPVEIDGTTVEKASLHNLSIMHSLYHSQWYAGLKLTVYKANQIIPQVREVNDLDTTYIKSLSAPHTCPICDNEIKIFYSNNTEELICTNPSCDGKLLGRLSHFVSKNAMNIDGLSEATLRKFIDKGWLKDFIDIYFLPVYTQEIRMMGGFGEKSADKLLTSIEDSKDTTLDRFIYALCIPLVGRTKSKIISKHFNGDFDNFYRNGLCSTLFDWTTLDDFGDAVSNSINNYLDSNFDMIWTLSRFIKFKKPQIELNPSTLTGLTFCITGSLNHFENRDAAKNKIESLGGKVSGSVSKKTSYLVNNDIGSPSSKNNKAKELSVPIITEEQLSKMMS